MKWQKLWLKSTYNNISMCMWLSHIPRCLEASNRRRAKMSEGRTQFERSLRCCGDKTTSYCRASPCYLSALCSAFIRQSGAVYCGVTGTRNTLWLQISMENFCNSTNIHENCKSFSHLTFCLRYLVYQ